MAEKNDPVKDLIERTRTERGLLPVIEDDAIIRRVARIAAIKRGAEFVRKGQRKDD